ASEAIMCRRGRWKSFATSVLPRPSARPDFRPTIRTTSPSAPQSPESSSRIRIPSRAKRYTATDGLDTWWPTPEPPHRINQIYLEPLLFAHAAAQLRVRVLHRSRLENFVQNEDGVIATVCDLESGDTFSVAADYLVGCDGGKSTVRKKIGARLIGTPVIQRVQSTFIRAPGLLSRLPGEPAWLYQVRNPRRCGTVFAIDGRDCWLVHNFLESGTLRLPRSRCQDRSAIRYARASAGKPTTSTCSNIAAAGSISAISTRARRSSRMME